MTNETIDTIFRTYRFDVTKPDEREAWKALSERLSATHRKHGPVMCETMVEPFEDGTTITLETKHLFSNQWNTADSPVHGRGRRVFDWKIGVYYVNGRPLPIKFGHYLEQAPRMVEIRRNTHCCGYCGHQEEAARGLVFCDRCIDSEYLKPGDLHLLRMLPVDESEGDRKPLSDREAEMLFPLYRAAQLHGSTERGKARIAKARATIAKDFEKSMKAATTKRDGFTWMMDRGINPDLAIYYSHTDTFSFGWRGNGLSADVVAELLQHMSEFPFNYEIKCDDGRTLNG